MRTVIDLHPEEREALIALAQRERRPPREQAGLIIRRYLVEVGLLDQAVPMLGADVTERRAVQVGG